VATARSAAAARILKGCGGTFDELGLSAAATLEARVDEVTDVIVGRARHLAERVYPPLNLGPTGLFGPAPVGIRTLDLVDASRQDVTGTAPRPLTTALYYPSTPAAVAGVPRDFDVAFPTPAYRDVARAPGRLPLVLFSPGAGGSHWQYVYLAAHLASHGFLVATIDHHGDHFLDTRDPNSLVNRPLDMSAVLDQLLAFDSTAGSFLEGAIDADRIGAAGHSRGGYAALAMATCPISIGDFADSRFRANLSLEAAVQSFGTDAPGLFSTIRIPTLLLTGATTELAPVNQFAFDALSPGPTPMGFVRLIDALHATFSDSCEVPDAIVEAFNGGPLPECEPGAMPWRYARHIIDYLALNFFDATLNGNPEALARLDPAKLAAIEETISQRRTGEPPAGAQRPATTQRR